MLITEYSSRWEEGCRWVRKGERVVLECNPTLLTLGIINANHQNLNCLFWKFVLQLLI